VLLNMLLLTLLGTVVGMVAGTMATAVMAAPTAVMGMAAVGTVTAAVRLTSLCVVMPRGSLLPFS
jgi:hypothetical protein